MEKVAIQMQNLHYYGESLNFRQRKVINQSDGECNREGCDIYSLKSRSKLGDKRGSKIGTKAHIPNEKR